MAVSKRGVMKQAVAPRNANDFMGIVNRCSAAVYIQKGNSSANARSLFGLIFLKLSAGDTVSVIANSDTEDTNKLFRELGEYISFEQEET